MAEYYYTAVAWARSVGAPTATLTLNVIDNNQELLGQQTFVVGTDWTPMRVIFRTQQTTTQAHINIHRQGASALAVEITGYGIYAGQHPGATFNSGFDGAASEDLTPMVLSASGDSGSNAEPMRLTPIDGELKIYLNNSDQRFTPRNTGSPYQGKFKRRALVVVEAQIEASRWEPLWTGLYDSLELDVGLNSTRQAILTALHGLMYLDDQTLSYPPRYNQRTSDMLTAVLESQKLPAKRWAWSLDSARWGVNTFIADPRSYAQIDETAFVHNIAGAGWPEDVSVRKAIESLVQNEQGYALLDREGRLIFRARSALIPDAAVLASEAISIDLEAQGAEYRYGGIEATEIEVSYRPRAAYSGIIWQTKSEDPIKISRGESVEIMITPETPEGFPITVFSFQPLVSVHNRPTSSWFRAYNTVNARQEHLARFTLSNEGQKLRLHIVNTSTDVPDMQFEAALYGSGYMTKDEQTLVVRDETNLDLNDGQVVTKRLSLDLVANETEAKSLAYQILRLMRDMKDGFFELRYVFGTGLRDRERLKKVLRVKPGDMVRLTESQSHVTDELHLVIGEHFEWHPGTLTLTQSLLPIKPTDVWTLDASRWGVDTRVGY